MRLTLFSYLFFVLVSYFPQGSKPFILSKDLIVRPFKSSFHSPPVGPMTISRVSGDYVPEETSGNRIVTDVQFRSVIPQDILECFQIETSSYPPDEMASEKSLRYRQANAGSYFRCATIPSSNDKNDGKIVGFVCATRCDEFDEESMSIHVPSGRLLAIHSVVVEEQYRRMGLATAMLQDYISFIEKECKHDGNKGIAKIVLIAKSNLLGFYVNVGFSVTGVSKIIHGKDRWYDLELSIEKRLMKKELSSFHCLPRKGDLWFVKTEKFILGYLEVKPYLEAHRAWVADLRLNGCCITSGYRVDGNGQPGGGGLMLFAAASYADAEDLVRKDPLIANGCVEWKLNGWISEVGELQLR